MLNSRLTTLFVLGTLLCFLLGLGFLRRIAIGAGWRDDPYMAGVLLRLEAWHIVVMLALLAVVLDIGHQYIWLA